MDTRVARHADVLSLALGRHSRNNKVPTRARARVLSLSWRRLFLNFRAVYVYY